MRQRLTHSKVLPALLWCCVICSVLVALGRFVLVSHWQLHSPFDLSFETPNLGVIQAIKAGLPLYDPATYKAPPFLLLIYNPLFFQLVAWLPQSPENLFWVGRLISLLAMCGIGLSLFFVARQRRPLLSPAPWLAVGWLFLLHQPTRYAAFLRQDGLGILCSLLAILLLARGSTEESQRAGVIRMSAVVALAFCAFLTKQTLLSAAAASFCYLWLTDRRRWLLFCALGVAVFGGFALTAQLVWGAGYWSVAFVAMANNPIVPLLFVKQWQTMLQQPAFVLLLCCFVGVMGWGTKRWGRQFWKPSPYPLYALFSLLALCVSVGKYGSDRHYFLELMAATLCLLLSTLTLLRSADEARAEEDEAATPQERATEATPREAAPKDTARLLLCLAATGVLACAVYELTWFPPHKLALSTPKKQAYISGVYRRAEREIRSLLPKGGRFLSLDTHVINIRMQRPGTLNDTFAYWLFWNRGVFEVKPLLQAIRKQQYDLILLQPRPLLPVFMPGLRNQKVAVQIRKQLDRSYRLLQNGLFLYYAPKKLAPRRD